MAIPIKEKPLAPHEKWIITPMASMYVSQSGMLKLFSGISKDWSSPGKKTTSWRDCFQETSIFWSIGIVTIPHELTSILFINM